MRAVELSIESGDDLDVRSFTVLENLSAAFRIDLRALAREDSLDLGKLIGKRASLRLADDRGARSWTGVCAEAAQTAAESRGLSTYTLRIVPALWLLTHRKNHRLFQHLTAPEIASKILGEWGIHPVMKLAYEYPKLALRTQYGESDYDFVRRLLAEAGASFFFHTDPGEDTRLVVSDAPESAPPLPTPIPFQAGAPPSISHVHIAQQVAPSRVTMVDHDFRRPRYALAATHAAASAEALLERYHYAPGHSLGEARGAIAEPMADSLGAYRHGDRLAQTQAQNRAEGYRANQTRVGYTTSAIELSPGTILSIEGHPHPVVANGKKLLVTNSWLHGDVDAEGWHARGRAVPADAPFHPTLEHENDTGAPHDPFEAVQHDGKPRIFGVESAIVTGPPGEDVHTDEHGRVTVHFPWDREGRPDGTSSPWIRVSQAWAGPGYGVHALPRVGHEVLVGFHDGDPDHPVVVGRVHDTTAPVPYELPEHKMRTSIRSSTKPAATGGVGLTGGTSAAPSSGGSASANHAPSVVAAANEITFDDAPGKELFYMQAARDLHKLVGRDELELTKGSRSIHVDGDLRLSAAGKITLVSGKDMVVKGGPKVLLNPSEPPKAGKKPAPLEKGTGGTGVPSKPAQHHAPAPKGGISAQGKAEMAALMRAARAHAGGQRPGGYCLEWVENYLQEITYGKIGHGNIPRFEYAHDFADYLNAGDRYKTLGLQKLPITNPYDAPEGSIIVVRAGTPGTANPVAGDIVVKGPGDHFYNDGEMGYGGPQNFPPSHAAAPPYVLGVYAPE